MDRMNFLCSLRPYLHNKTFNKSPYNIFKIKNLNHSFVRNFKDTRINKSNLSQASHVFGGSSAVVLQRAAELEADNALQWPRIKKNASTLAVSEFRTRWKNLTIGDNVERPDHVTVMGKLMACRVMGTRLIFMDLMQDGHLLQVMANLSSLSKISNVSEESFQRFYHIVQRGDYISVFGHAHVTNNGQLSLMADALPGIISPALARLPRTLQDPESKMRNRHVDLLLNPKLQQTLKMRSILIQYIRNFLLEDQFVEVQTPLIAYKASGAMAKPFLTTSTVISNKQLSFRVAPEMWLKRLIIGGLDRIFEIGPAFRNEGFDTTHNPEFTTCEFYKAFSDLEELVGMTENLISGLVKAADSAQKEHLSDLPKVDTTLYGAPFKRLAFVPALEAALGEKLPDLASETATEQVAALFNRHNIPLVTSPTLPRLLDKLSSIYIETRCSAPTFIMYHPVCMAPLAKSFLDPECSQIVSARAELFVNGIELANMYEEENSPIEQRFKFEEQARHPDIESEGSVDESYLSALEWGLPPTGGWGCGVDRLVMLMTGTERISDVLSFGSLKNVVSVATNGKKTNG